MWKILAASLLPLLRLAGEAKKNEDADTAGKDDMIGISLVYAADLIDAIITGKSLPKAPKGLR